MLIAIFGVSCLFFILLLILTRKCYLNFGVIALYALIVIIALVSIVIFLLLLPEAMPLNESVIDEKITMYQEENARIEESIDALVSQYMVYETETFDSVASGESSITYVSLFPELKSNELVRNQIDIYYSNAEKIKKLKVEKIEISHTRWLLYFGR